MFQMFDIYSILKHFICLHICIVSLARDGAGEGAAIENIARIKPNGRNQMTIKVIRTRTFNKNILGPAPETPTNN